MRFFLLVALAALACARSFDEEFYLFNDFKSTYNRAYSASEESHRFGCFQKNLAQIDELNKQDDLAHYGINQFADMCAEEFGNYHNLRYRAKNVTNPVRFSADAIAATPSSMDWRQRGAVTAVKNQGQCGSCWSFSTTGNLEGQWFLAGNTLTAFSEEELVECSHNGNMGCKGGLMDDAFEWIQQNGGIDTEGDYPYTSGTGNVGSCNVNKASRKIGHVNGHVDVEHDETQMQAFVAARGPTSVAVDAGSGWQLYGGGIKTSCYAGQLDHGVLIVGYGEENGTPYWIVKNSWGASWGENGYIRLKRGVNCNGIKESPCSATVNSN